MYIFLYIIVYIFIFFFSGNQKTIMTNMNVVKTHVTELQSKVKKNVTVSKESCVEISQKQLQIVAKCFPIDDKEKKLETVEEKLSNTTFQIHISCK